MNKLDNNKASAQDRSVSGGKKVLEGVVVSDKMEKTAVVAVNTFKAHPKYLKRYLSTKRYKAHDGENKCKVGEKVKIVEVKPMSKGKKWTVVY
ncbi:MAG: 30S ribosomal protein S17 [Candidatus Moraniibacteriota bacterium]